MQAKDLYFSVMSEVVVVGCDSEMADYDNPRGNVYETIFVVVAELSDGRRFVAPGSSANESAVARMADALVARAANGLLPVGFSRWNETQPRYGSDAYLDQNCEAEQILLEKEEAFSF